MAEYEYEGVDEENEFEGLGAQGLKDGETKTEGEETRTYFVVLLVVMPIMQTLFGFGLYFLGAEVFKQKVFYDAKFALIHEYQAGWVYVAVLMLNWTRTALVVNSNGARAEARVERPNQHVYKVMDKDGSFKDAPFVLMAGTGPQGRFNRAQRGLFNTDEFFPMTIAASLITGFVFGPMVCVILLLTAYGAITMGCKYKEAASSRAAGFLPRMIADGMLFGLVIVSAIKGLFYPSLSF